MMDIYSISDRKLKNLDCVVIRKELMNVLDSSKEWQKKIILSTLELITKRACDSYNYTVDDHILIKEGLRTYHLVVPKQLLRIIEKFERMNGIRSIWLEKDDLSNIRGENYMLDLNE